MAQDLRKVNDIESLMTYFSEKLGWAIDPDDYYDIDDITYDFDAADLGLKEEAFAKITSLKQLRPLVDDQRWGIFFVNFESNRFEVSALRKILSGLVPARRNADHAVWDKKDLLFLCTWGERNNVTIGAAYFEDAEKGLPQIKMISCEPAVEDFTQINIFEQRLAKLAWPCNPSDTEAWHDAWASAFTTRYRQTIQDSHTLTIRLAEEAQNIRDRILSTLEIETTNGYVHLLFEKFRNTLVHDMTELQFADMYAQTVVYGLFSARCMDQSQNDFNAAEAVECIPNTNPFLKGLLQECLGSNTARSKLSFDELEVGNIVDLLLHTKTDSIITDFNRQTGGGREDPVIHFYEEFLSEYDKSQRVQRGVYYTPQPVVNFIVRAVDDILKSTFGVADGLASTDTKKIKFLRQSKKRVDGYYTNIEDEMEVPAIQILDPATGTGTFLRQTILQIYENFCSSRKGKAKAQIQAEWNTYVPQHLLPRLNGFELMMAPYAVAHMKLAMVLKDTGYNFDSDERLKVFLTNTLEKPGNSEAQLTLWDDPLAFEAISANAVKKNSGINIVLGNPPYSVSSSNKGDWIQNLIVSYKQGLNEKKLNLDDDYIKFIRYGQYVIENAGQGVLAYISNNSFLDGVTHRQMRTELQKTFDCIYIIDLHGSSKRHEVCPDGSKDENVFDIQQGVSINIFVKTTRSAAPAIVNHFDLFGLREYKYAFLNKSTILDIEWDKLSPSQPYFFFAPKDFSKKAEYEKGFLLTELFDLNNSGIKTDRDSLFIDRDKDALAERVKKLLSGHYDTAFVEKYRVQDSSSYKLTEKIKHKTFDSAYLRPIIYRPYDVQWIYYDPSIISRPGYQTMQHMLYENWGLYVKRGFEDSEAPPAFCCNQLVCMRAWSRPGSIGSEYLFPLYQYSTSFGQLKRRPNFKVGVAERIQADLHMSMSETEDAATFSPLDLLDYIYGVLHDTEYITKYREFLKIEFPRVPYPRHEREFRKYANYGKKLRYIHCMIDSAESDHVSYLGNGSNCIEKIKWNNDSVIINVNQRFNGITKAMWEYYVGGYQPLQKWLKDRKNQILSDTEIAHYKKMCYALERTMVLVSDFS